MGRSPIARSDALPGSIPVASVRSVPEKAPVCASHAEASSAICATTDTVPSLEPEPASVTETSNTTLSHPAVVPVTTTTGVGDTPSELARRMTTTPLPPSPAM